MTGHDRDFMALAQAAAEQSEDRSRKVGCVIVGPDDRVRSSGCNCFPAGVDAGPAHRHLRPEKYLWIEHAERNAIYHAARRGIALAGCRIYLPWFPCMDCARALVQAGIVELIAFAPDLDDPQWGGDFRRVQTLLAEAGVAVRCMEPA